MIYYTGNTGKTTKDKDNFKDEKKKFNTSKIHTASEDSDTCAGYAYHSICGSGKCNS